MSSGLTQVFINLQVWTWKCVWLWVSFSFLFGRFGPELLAIQPAGSCGWWLWGEALQCCWRYTTFHPTEDLLMLMLFGTQPPSLFHTFGGVLSGMMWNSGHHLSSRRWSSISESDAWTNQTVECVKYMTFSPPVNTSEHALSLFSCWLCMSLKCLPWQVFLFLIWFGNIQIVFPHDIWDTFQ